MRTFIADIIPKLQRFSKKLDDLTLLTNQHWVSLDEIRDIKRVYIFRSNNQLLISSNGVVEKATWEYLGNNSVLVDTKGGSYLLKHGFFDENVIALKIDSNNQYAFLINETKYDKELNSIENVLDFLQKKYLDNNSEINKLKSTDSNSNIKAVYNIDSEIEVNDFAWGSYTTYKISFSDGKKFEVYKGKNTGKYFIWDIIVGRIYCNDLEDAIFKGHPQLNAYKNGL